MLGKTNTFFVSSGESSSIQLVQETILTASVADIEKTEYINEYYFVFLSDQKVLFGKNISSLAILKNGSNDFLASHVIYADNKYYFARAVADATSSTAKAYVYATNDFTSFDEIVLFNSYGMAGLYKSSEGKIIALIRKKELYTGFQLYMITLDSFTDYIEEASLLKRINLSFNNEPNTNALRNAAIIKDRIVMETKKDSLSNTSIISLDGTCVLSDSKCNYYAHEHFYSQSSIKDDVYSLYYSINGINYSLLGSISSTKIIQKILEFENDAIGIFFDDNGVSKFTVATAPGKIIEALGSAVEINIIGDILFGIDTGGYTYIGCSGGVILKTYVDYSGSTNIPEVTVLKTLSAKQALESAKEYTNLKTEELKEYILSLISGSTEV